MHDLASEVVSMHFWLKKYESARFIMFEKKLRKTASLYFISPSKKITTGLVVEIISRITSASICLVTDNDG